MEQIAGLFVMLVMLVLIIRLYMMAFKRSEDRISGPRRVKEQLEKKALLELLYEKGVITEEEYTAKVSEVKEKAHAHNPDLDLSAFEAEQNKGL